MVDLSPPRTRSYSAAGTYSECGYKFKLERIDKVPQKPALWYPAGSAFHSTCDDIDHVEFATGEWLTDEDVEKFWNINFTEEIAERNPEDEAWRTSGRKSKANPNGYDVDWWNENGPKMAIAYRDWRKEHPEFEIWTLPDGNPAIEVKIETVIGVSVVQYVDRVFVDTETGALMVVDLKTSERVPHPLQLADYRVGLEQTFHTPIWYGSYYMAKKGVMTPPVDLSHWTPELMAERYEMFDRAERSGIYLPVIGDHCGYCSVKDYCPFAGGTLAAQPQTDLRLTA